MVGGETTDWCCGGGFIVLGSNSLGLKNKCSIACPQRRNYVSTKSSGMGRRRHKLLLPSACPRMTYRVYHRSLHNVLLWWRRVCWYQSKASPTREWWSVVLSWVGWIDGSRGPSTWLRIPCCSRLGWTCGRRGVEEELGISWEPHTGPNTPRKGVERRLDGPTLGKVTHLCRV